MRSLHICSYSIVLAYSHSPSCVPS